MTRTTIPFTSVLSALVLSACATTAEPKATPPLADTEGKADGSDRDHEDGNTQQTSSLQEHCVSDGTLDFRLAGAGLSAYDGNKVWAAGIESTLDNNAIVSTRRVLLSGVIANGGFVVACPDAIDVNTRYPSWALFIDDDEDGACGDGDVGAQELLYGWAADVNEQVTPAAWHSTTQLSPHLYADDDLDFCGSYF